MKFVEFKECKVANLSSTAISISGEETSLHVSFCHFSFLHSETPGSAVFFNSSESIIEKTCGLSCSSTPSKEPGGVFLYVCPEIESNKKNSILLISASLMKNNYSTIVLRYGDISYSNLNVSKGNVRYYSGYYIGSSSGTLDAVGSYVNVKDCTSEYEIIFNQMSTHKLTNANIINNTSVDTKISVYRSWRAITELTNVIFKDNSNNLFNPAETESKIILNNCYGPADTQKRGDGELKGTLNNNEVDTLRLHLTNCKYVRMCTIVKKRKINRYYLAYAFICCYS